MAEIKTRYFVSERTFLIRNRRFRPGQVIPFAPDECEGRKSGKGKTVVVIDKPSRHMIETDHRGVPLEGSLPVSLQPDPDAGPLDKPITMHQARGQAKKPAPGPKPGKSDKDL